MMVQANMTDEERKIDKEILEINKTIKFLCSEFDKLNRKNKKDKKDIGRLKDIQRDVSFYLIKRNSLCEKLYS